MGLCFDLGAVLEGHPDVVLAVDGDVVDQRVVAFLVFRLVEGDMCVFIDGSLSFSAARGWWHRELLMSAEYE